MLQQYPGHGQGGGFFISDAEVCRTMQSMPKMRARSFGPLTAPSHVAMTIGSRWLHAVSQVCLGEPFGWPSCVGREGAVARGTVWMVMLRWRSVAIARLEGWA